MTRLRLTVLVLALIGLALGSIVTVGATAPGGASLIYDGEELTLAAGPNQTIRGHANLSAGSTLTVRLVSDNATSPFVQSERTTVTENGSFAVRVDLSGIDPGTEFTLTVRHDGGVLINTTGTVVACDDSCEAASSSSKRGDANTTLIYEGDQLTLAAGQNQTITGRTDLEPGSLLTIRLQSDSPEHPFLRTVEATVTENGTFETTVDLSGMEPGTEFAIFVMHDDDRLYETTGTIVACEDNCTKSPSAPESDTPTTTLLYEGDQLTLNPAPNQSIEGRTDLDPGAVLTVRLQSDSPSHPFLLTTQTTVDEDGSFEATIDLSEMEPETEFTVTVHYDGTVLLETTGSIVACKEGCAASSIRSPADGDGTSLVYEGDQPTLAAGPGQTIRGRTDLDPGTVLTIRLRSESPANPFLHTAKATVTDYGTFETTVNLSSMTPGTEFRIIVQHNETVLLETTGSVVACDGNCVDDTAGVDTGPTKSLSTSTRLGRRPRTILLGTGALLGAGVLSIVGLGILLGVFRS